ncbi:hypothetical protein E2493_11625 [Sphingomonas parva]|uniref:Dihydrodipicolinate reductase n=1 Tax=Sphingomonas parva TaxID=2555898 RepID=A0A4Y8ZPW2_9SPHN|nr:hypothetical protein [Sphingomonas parva]TFI58048.1 hypothetical protein E2493_11625 [Sphingomonas parva]
MRRFFALGLAAALGACATGGGGDRSPRSAALVGQTLEVRTAAGQVSTLRLGDGGAVTARFGGREVAGRWAMDGDELCFTWSGNFRECWPYAVPLRRGQTRAITSDRGNKVQVTAR